MTNCTVGLVSDLRLLFLHADEREFSHFLDKLPVGIYTCTPDGLITYFNQSALDLWGRAPRLGDADDRYSGAFKSYTAGGQPLGREHCGMALALNTQEDHAVQEVMFLHPDGQRRTVKSQSSPIRDKSGKLLGAITILEDISDKVQPEDIFEQAQPTKEELWALLTYDLGNPIPPLRGSSDFMLLPMQSPTPQEKGRQRRAYHR